MLSPLRIIVPLLLDVLVVKAPEQIRQIEASGDVDRLNVYGTSSLPWWVRFFFKATKFHDVKRDLWFLPFESARDPAYLARREYLAAKVREGYRPEDVRSIADLLTANADDATLAHAMVQVVNRRFVGDEIPRHVSQAANLTLQNFTEAVSPQKYRRALAARAEILEYCAERLPPTVHLLDVSHNIGEVMQATAHSLKHLRDNLDAPLEQTFTEHAPTPQVPRIAIKRSRLDGLLWIPLRPGKTVVILKIGKAAKATRDLLFTFGTGREERSCVFMQFFLDFMTDLQNELRSRRAANQVGSRVE